MGQLGSGGFGKELGLRVAGVLPCMQADHSEGCSKRVQAGTFRRQTTWGDKLCLPQPLSLDSQDIFPLLCAPPELPVAGATLAVASASA